MAQSCPKLRLQESCMPMSTMGACYCYHTESFVLPGSLGIACRVGPRATPHTFDDDPDSRVLWHIGLQASQSAPVSKVSPFVEGV
jgi:hypothetical protein